MAIGWLDPFSLLVRSIGLSLLPAFNFAVRVGAAPLEHSHVAAIKTTGESLHTVLQATVLDFRQAHFAQGLVLGVLFLVMLCGSLRVTRLWCRAICPLGALLGAVSRWSILGLHKDAASCDKCNRCLLHCQGGDDPIGGVPWRKVRVPDVYELRGQLSARKSDVSSSFARNAKLLRRISGRRKALTGLAAGAAAGSADAREYRAWQRAKRSATAATGRRGRRAIFFHGAFAAASA